MLINTNLNFKIHTDSMGLVAILFEDGIFVYYNGNEMVEIGEIDLYRFLYQAKACYVDENHNLRALVLSYEASKSALYEGRTLRDKEGSTYELDSETGMVLINGGDVKYRQLPFAKYILDIQRNIEIQREEEERQREEARRLEEESRLEEERQCEERRQAALEAANAPKKKGIPWGKIAAAFGGAILLAGGIYGLTKK